MNNPVELGPHIATCSCGALSVTVTGNAARVHGCSCLACQRRTGSAFSYTAFFTERVVAAITGTGKIYRETRENGAWHDYHFCPTCGVAVYFSSKAVPGHIGIPVGCFADPAFVAPDRFLWTKHRHHWLPLPEGMESLETQ